MAAVEKRVMGEVAKILVDHFNYIDANDTVPGDDNAAYPWMTPFTDPKVTHNNLLTTGRHDGGNDSASLIDNSQNFIAAGVVVGDVVHNLTDGSIGMVTNVAATTLGIFGLSQGDENDFDGGRVGGLPLRHRSLLRALPPSDAVAPDSGRPDGLLFLFQCRDGGADSGG